MKIAIIGYSGAGKSTLAKILSQKYGCPFLYLDTVSFTAGWKERDRESGREIVQRFMENESWVIDGNYQELCQKERLALADQIIFLNFPRITCFYRALKRCIGYKHKVRESIAEGCNEKFDLEFIWWILADGRSRECRMGYKKICEEYKDKIIICKNKRDVKRLTKA